MKMDMASQVIDDLVTEKIKIDDVVPVHRDGSQARSRGSAAFRFAHALAVVVSGPGHRGVRMQRSLLSRVEERDSHRTQSQPFDTEDMPVSVRHISHDDPCM
ncbi:hypothetical protein V2G26_007439 [Clonostachys chloroleuca]